MIADRAKNIFAKPSCIYETQLICKESPFHAQDNPEGFINLGIAENRLMWDWIKEKIQQPRPVIEDDTHYGIPFGTEDFRAAMAKFINRSFRGAKVSAEQIVAANGLTAIIDMLGFALCNPNEGIIVPAPYYAAFDADFAGRSQVQVVPAYLKADSFKIDFSSLEQAWQKAKKDGIPVRALLITSPSNPLGRILAEDEILASMEFAEKYQIHCIFDEIYAHSCFPEVNFVSALSLLHRFPNSRDKIHFLYGMSKDFALAGLRVGLFQSENPKLLEVMQQLSYFSNVSLDSQRFLTTLFSDETWIDKFLRENRKRLKLSHQQFYSIFKDFAEDKTTSAGVFSWMNFGHFLKDKSFAGEKELHSKMLQTCRVNILPGQGFNCSVPGWFRLCFTHPLPIIETAAQRLKQIL